MIGRRAIPLLVRAGHEVTGAGRSLESLRELERVGASSIVLDLFDRVAVRQAVAGKDVVVNLATHVPSTTFRQFLYGSWKEMNRIRTQGSQLLVDAAMAAGVRGFVQESFAPVYPDSGDRWIHENVPLQPVRYNRSVLDAEASVDRFAKSGGAGVALRFAFFYGSHDGFTHDVLRYVRRGWLPLLGRPDGFFSMVNHEDAASAVVAALDAPSGAYNVVDDEPLTRRQFGDALARMQRVRPPRLPPRWIIRFTGSLGTMMARSLRISNDRLKSATSWVLKYPTVESGWSAAAVVDP